jgi:dsDNA-specific endonuclease/ATPase MutS2
MTGDDDDRVSPDDGEALELDDDASVELEVTDVLDLHSFPPSQVADLVRDYLDLAVERGFAQVRIVHGRGVGVQRKTVRTILERDTRVEAFGDAPGEAGGWGATWARLRSTPEDSP